MKTNIKSKNINVEGRKYRNTVAKKKIKLMVTSIYHRYDYWLESEIL